MLEELNGKLDLKRLRFTGLLNYGDLVQLFAEVICIVILLAHVVSWGVYQAAACGASYWSMILQA